jgi:hypothetical protein
MKKIVISLSLLAVSLQLSAQSQRRVLVEEFTQASCGPCAQQNPAYNALLQQNTSKVAVIKYQTSWPGVDPMNADNASEVQTRVNYYAVTGVPDVELDGTKRGVPYYVHQASIDSAYNVPSPFTINLTSHLSSDADSLYITAIIKATQAVSGTLKAHIVVVEDLISFDIAPNVVNGVKDFENVMKRMLPSSAGTTLPTSYAIGDSTITNIGWKIAKVYDVPQLSVVAFVQNNANKQVQQAEFNKPVVPYALTLKSTGKSVSFCAQSSANTFNANFTTSDPAGSTYRFKIDKSQLPSGWSASMVINSITYTDSADIAVTGSGSQSATVIINSGSTPNQKGIATLLVNDAGSSQEYKKMQSFTAYSDITTLFITRESTAIAPFTSALNAGGNSFVLMSSLLELSDLDSNGFNKSNIDHIILNEGQSYSGLLLLDEEIANLKHYLKTGGNLFICGNRIGLSAYGTGSGSDAEFQNFYSDYLGAAYSSIGTVNSNPVNPVAGEPVFGNLTPTSIINGSIYGEHMTANGANAVPILSYSSASDYCAMRNHSNTNNWKVVFVGVNYTDLVSLLFKNQFLDKSIEWFDGLVSGIDGEAVHQNGIGTIYPNPSNGNVYVSTNGLTADATLEIRNITGQVVFTSVISKSAGSVSIDMSTYPAGIYSCRFYNMNGNLSTQNIAVIK